MYIYTYNILLHVRRGRSGGGEWIYCFKYSREDAHYNNKLYAEAVTSVGKPDVIATSKKKKKNGTIPKPQTLKLKIRPTPLQLGPCRMYVCVYAIENWIFGAGWFSHTTSIEQYKSDVTNYHWRPMRIWIYSSKSNYRYPSTTLDYDWPNNMCWQTPKSQLFNDIILIIYF